MHHLYPTLRGDQLCPLGFHPQTRYPTRCKRCFRDYKEHGSRRSVDDVTISSPNLSDGSSSRPSTRSWTSTQNLSSSHEATNNNNSITNDIVVHFNVELKKRPQSWNSTPNVDRGDERSPGKVVNFRATEGGQKGPLENNIDVTLRLPTPPRRHTAALDDIKEKDDAEAKRRSTTSSSSSPSPARNIPDELIIHSSDGIAERVRKMQLLKKQRSRERSIPRKNEDEINENEKRSSLPAAIPEKSETHKSPSDFGLEEKRSYQSTKKSNSSTSMASSTSLTATPGPTTVPYATTSQRQQSTATDIVTKAATATATAPQSSTDTSKTSSISSVRRKEADKQRATQDVEFLLKVKDANRKEKRPRMHDNHSMITEATDATLVGLSDHELLEEVKSLRSELEATKTRAERAEREKSDILLRRLAALDTAPNRTAASEALALQQKVNELKEQLEKVSEEKRRLNIRMKELEHSPKNSEYELRRKLQAAEQLCEELMEENQDVKREIRNLEAEMDEMHDSFRDNQAEVNTTLQKQLEATTKNCRILSFKLKKCERKIDTMEQERKSTQNEDLALKIRKLEEELRFSNDLAKKLQAEADELRHPGRKKAPTLGVIGKSTSADAKFSRESLTRGGSQEDPQQLLRDLEDSVERESDLKEQLKFAEEEAENLRKKVARFEDENDSLMMQLKKMATRSRTRKLSPTPRRHLAPEVQADRDEGISDDDDPAELRILLELNEQEASILRLKVEDLEKENSEIKKQMRELHSKMAANEANVGRKSPLLSFGSGSNASEKRLKVLNEELAQLRKTITEKDRSIERLQAENKASSGKGLAKNNDSSIDVKRQLDLVEQEAAILRSKINTLESENEKLLKENKRMQLQALRKSSLSEKTDNGELIKLKESLAETERQREELNAKLKSILQGADEKLPPRVAKRITDLTPKNHLKKWVEELEEEISQLRAIVARSGSEQMRTLETEKKALEEELQALKGKMAVADNEIQKLKMVTSSASKVSGLEQKLKNSEDDGKKLTAKIKDLEEKVKKQDSQIKQIESAKNHLETLSKRDKERLCALEREYEKERKERESWEAKSAELDEDLRAARKAAEKTKMHLEKEIKELKIKSTTSSKSDSKQVQELKKKIEELEASVQRERDSYADLNTHWEKLSEETILMRAQLTTEKQNLIAELSAAKMKSAELEQLRTEKTELAKKLKDAQKKVHDLEEKSLKSGGAEYEKTALKHKLADREQEYDRLRRENDMNIDLVFQLRKDNDELNRKLSDFNRVEQVQSSINEQNASLEGEIKVLRAKLENTELQLKSEVAATRLRYEQQVKNLGGELTSMQRQCERFKKDRDTFKQMLESAQKKIADLKASNTGRQSRSSMHSSDEDDKSKIAYLEQQVGCLEDHLVEARLEVSRVKTELVSERSANEIKISEMQSKLNEFEEERVIGSGRTKIPGMKTKLELSWQKEREDQQRLLQETSTLARDLRQTLFEVERERDKERLESKRRLDQLKRATEEEMEEGRRKIAELQCDLLELRDVHAKLRTSNEKLRRERERYEKELVKRRMEQDGGERKLASLLQTVDELVRIAPDLKMATSRGGAATKTAATSGPTLRPEAPNSRRSRSPSPTLTAAQIAGMMARLAEASEEFRKFQRLSEDENERSRIKRGSLRRAASQETDPHGSTGSMVATAQRNGSKLSRSAPHNGSLIRKSLSLDQTIQQDQSIWRQEDGSLSSMQSIDSDLGGMVRDSSFDSRLDSRLSGGSTQSDIPMRGPRKKKKGLMGKLRSLTKSNRNSESEVSVQGSDSDISVASDMRASKKDLRGRLSGMFKRSGSASRSASTERAGASSSQRPVAVTIVGHPDGPEPREPPPANLVTPKPIRSIPKPSTPTTPLTKRRLAK